MMRRQSLVAACSAVGLFTALPATAVAAKPGGQAELSMQVQALQSAVAALEARLARQEAAGQAADADLTRARADAARAEALAQALKTQLATRVETLPVVPVAGPPQAAAPSRLAYKDVSLTLGGFLAAETIYRSKGEAADISSNFNAIPFASNRAGHAQELRFSARQSRISALVQGAPNARVKLAMYGELDFQGAAQTANSNESNSYTPRLRQMYGTVDWEALDLHLLAGQAWSLATLNTQGITPRNELPPPQIDGQFIPGFVWTRQPQVRLTKAWADRKLWLSVSLENPQTTVSAGGVGPGAGAVPADLTFNAPGGTGFNAANSVSLNHVPDVIAKLAYEGRLGVPIHAEIFGLYRDVYWRFAASNHDATGGGVGAGLVVNALPGVLDLQLSGLYGNGVGRYGTSQLPDATVGPDGQLHTITETMALAGATLHAGRRTDVYLFAGEERAERRALTGPGGAYGYGNPAYVNLGCFHETPAGVCNGNTRSISQVTLGAWNRIYQGAFGRLQVGAQYAYTERRAFSGVGGAPRARENMVFTSLRYYPF